jgi:hypothetical protein
MPPDMPSSMRAQSEASEAPPFVLDAAMRRELGIDATRNTLAWVLLALALAVLGLAAYIALRPRAAAPAETEAPAAEAPATTPEPTPVGQGTPVPSAGQPTR